MSNVGKPRMFGKTEFVPTVMGDPKDGIRMHDLVVMICQRRCFGDKEDAKADSDKSAKFIGRPYHEWVYDLSE